MAPPRYDAAAHAAHADRLTALAKTGRDTLAARSAEHIAAIEIERDTAARRAYGANNEAAAAEQQVKRALETAKSYDAMAVDAEAAAAKANATDRSEQLEQASILRANAEGQRRRAHEADEQADRLRAEQKSLETVVSDAESRVGVAQAESLAIDRELDQVERLATDARKRAEWAGEADRLDQEAAAADAAGDTARAATLRGNAQMHRDYIDSSADGTDIELTRRPEDAELSKVGVSIGSDDLDIPGLGAPVFAPESGARSDVTPAPGDGDGDVSGDDDAQVATIGDEEWLVDDADSLDDISVGPDADVTAAPVADFATAPDADFATAPDDDFATAPDDDFAAAPDDDFAATPDDDLDTASFDGFSDAADDSSWT